MAWYAPGTGKRPGRSRTRVAKGAVPLGQHSHHPDQVLPLPDPPASGLPTPAGRGAGCSCCARMAALIDPATGRGYCADHWITAVVQGQLD